MPKLFLTLAAMLVLTSLSTPALAGAGSFTIVNGTTGNMTSLAIRRFGTSDWRPLSAAPAAGARAPVPFSDSDCAFDFRAELAGGAVATWQGVNLCEANVVTLRRGSSGETWVDYD